MLEQFKDWLTQVASEWRQQVAKLPAEATTADQDLNYLFRSPCQIDVLYFHHPLHNLDFRICVVSHFADEPDLQIRILGPWHPHIAASVIEEYLKDPRWQRPISKEQLRGSFLLSATASTYGDALRDRALELYRPLQTYLNNTVKSEGVNGREYGSGFLVGDCYTFGIAGSIEGTEADVPAYVSRELARLLAIQQRASSRGALSQKVSDLQGFGAFLLPPRWIVSVPQRTIREYLEGTRPVVAAHRNVVLRANYQGRPIAVTQSAFFAVAASRDEREGAAQYLNEIFAALLFQGHAAAAIAPSDLMTVNDVTAPFNSIGWEGEVNLEQINHFWGQTEWYPFEFSGSAVDLFRLRAALKDSEQYARLDDRKLVMQICLEASTALRRRECRSAFLSAWTAIELNCTTLWKRYLAPQITSQILLDELDGWDVSRITWMLRKEGLLRSEQAGPIGDLRLQRNRVLHRGYAPTESDARGACTQAMRLTSEVWQLPGPLEE